MVLEITINSLGMFFLLWTLRSFNQELPALLEERARWRECVERGVTLRQLRSSRVQELKERGDALEAWRNAQRRAGRPVMFPWVLDLEYFKIEL